MQVCLSQPVSKDTSAHLRSSCEVTVGGGEIRRAVPFETSGSSLPRGSTPPGRNPTEARKGSDGGLSGDVLG